MEFQETGPVLLFNLQEKRASKNRERIRGNSMLRLSRKLLRHLLKKQEIFLKKEKIEKRRAEVNR